MFERILLPTVVTALWLAGCSVEQAAVQTDGSPAAQPEFKLSRNLRMMALALAESGEYDEQLCVTAQRMIVHADPDDFTIHLQRGDGNAFHTIQMGIAPEPRIVRIAMSTTTSGPLGYDTYVACKMVDRDRINDELDLRLRGDDVSCRNVNELTYVTALEKLTDQQRQRYLDEGKPLRFVDDFVASGGGEWLPLKVDGFVRDAPGEYLEVQAPAVRVPWSREERVFHQGTQHCKLITLATMQRWMTNGALRDADRLFTSSRAECNGPTPPRARTGSCRFFFAPAGAYFCQDYSGSDWTLDAARDECAQRHASAQALRDADNAYEGIGGVFSNRSCAERSDVAPIIGTCVFNCARPDETLWQVSSSDLLDQNMARACDLFIPRGTDGSAAR